MNLRDHGGVFRLAWYRAVYARWEYAIFLKI